jgi:hypothetical protein
MDQATDIEPARIDDLLSQYRDLQSQFDRVRERVRRAEEEKTSVPRKIYDRVRAEYDRELDSIRARMSPVRDEIDRLNESLEANWRDASTGVHAIEEELAEAEFRKRIGEYTDEAYATLRQGLDARAKVARTRQARLQETLTAITSMRSPEAPEPPVENDAVAAMADAAPEVTPPPASKPAPPPVGEIVYERTTPDPAATPAPRGDRFENPHDWISDIKTDAPRTDRRVRLSNPRPPAPPAPPRDELDRALEPLTATHTGLPSLVFVTGPHAGHAIPLLPTSLTIGREHDNNVEIKDADVARYHARILRDRGEYVVEDLDSSTGTWVNGERQKRAVLTHGDVIRVGQTELALDFEWTTD